MPEDVDIGPPDALMFPNLIVSGPLQSDNPLWLASCRSGNLRHDRAVQRRVDNLMASDATNPRLWLDDHAMG